MGDKDNSEKVFVGPADVNWLKFKVAGIVWKLTRQNPISQVSYIPGVNRLAKWAFQVRVMSRDFEVQSTESSSEN